MSVRFRTKWLWVLIPSKYVLSTLKYSTHHNLTIALSFELLPQINKQNINKLLERVIRLVYDDYTFTFETLVRKDHTFSIHHKNMNYLLINTAQRMKFSIKDFFSKYDQIRRKLRILSHLLKKYLIETSFFVQCKIFKVDHSLTEKFF